MNIEIIGTNALIPNIYFTSIVLQSDSIDINFDVDKLTTQISNFSNDEYFQYLKFNVIAYSLPTTALFTSPTFEVKQISSLPSKVSCNLKGIQTTGSLNVAVVIYFDIAQYALDKQLPNSLKEIVTSILGKPIINIYPILYENGVLYTNVLDLNANTVESIVSDYRKIKSLETLNIVSPTLTGENIRYFNFIKSDGVQGKINNFVSFEWKSFLRYNSFFSDDSFSNFTIVCNISNSSKKLETITIKNVNNRISLLSTNTETQLVSYTDNSLLFYFSEGIEQTTKEYSVNYKISISYVDDTYVNFYNSIDRTGLFFRTYDSYYQFKNVIQIAGKFGGYPDDPSVIQPLYLDLSNNKFTSDFLTFYDNKVVFYKSPVYNLDIDLETLISNIASVLNPFLTTEQKLTNEDIQNIIFSLQLENSNYSMYSSFFNVMDTLFGDIERLLTNHTKTTIFYTKTFARELISISTTFFGIDEVNNDRIPVLSVNKLQDILSRYNPVTNTVEPKFIVNNRQKNEFTNRFDFDSKPYNTALTYCKSLLNNKAIGPFEQILSEDSLLENLGVLLTTTNLPIQPNISKQSNRASNFRNDFTTTNLKKFKEQRINLSDFDSLNENISSKIKQTNKFATSLVTGKIKETPESKDVLPRFYLYYYDDNVDGFWNRLTKTTTIVPNMLIKIEFDLDDENIFKQSKIETNKISLENNYFITGK